MGRPKKIKPTALAYEPVFSTTLKRLDAIDNKLYAKKWKKGGYSFERELLYRVKERAETIINQMYLKRNVETMLLQRLRDEYVYLTEVNPAAFLDLDEDGYYSYDYYNPATDSHVFIWITDTEINAFFDKLWKQVCTEIESHNYKLELA